MVQALKAVRIEGYYTPVEDMSVEALGTADLSLASLLPC